MTDKEKTAEILKRLQIMNKGFMTDNFIKIPEFRLGSGYDGFSQQGIDLFAVSPNKANRDDCNCDCIQKLCENNPNYDFCTVEKIIYSNQALGEE